MRPSYIVVLGMLAALNAQAGTLAEVVNKAWQRLPQAQSQASRQAELQANQSAASGLFPAPPAVGMGYRTDQFNRNIGTREIDVDISLPLWLPGERSARQHLANAESDRFTAEQRASRLQLAGEIREVVWQARLAENAQELAQRRLANARQIEADVARRVKVGDLARIDLLLAQSETMAAQTALGDAERELTAAKSAYKRIVGNEVLPAGPIESPQAGDDIDSHPLLLAKRNRVGVAQAKARLVSETRRDNPELSLGTRRERADFTDRYSNTLVVSVRIPLGTESRNAPRIAAAQVELAEAEADYQRQRFDIEQGIQRARADVDTVRRQTELAESRHALALENLQLIKKAFSLGEKSLFEYQRSQALVNESQLAAVQAKVELHRAIARLNQALGVLP